MSNLFIKVLNLFTKVFNLSIKLLNLSIKVLNLFIKTHLNICQIIEDTDRRDEDRLAVLEYELRTARETIAQLRYKILKDEVSAVSGQYWSFSS